MAKEKILVVEDDRDLRLGLARRLQASGYSVVLAADAIAAVRTARIEVPDLILLDIGLPAGNGFTVMEHYSQLGSLGAIPVVVLTGRDPSVTEARARNMGVAGFLIKPVENDKLLSTIARALRGEPDPAAIDTP
jgi:DNA-binding response OmpR family regulator